MKTDESDITLDQLIQEAINKDKDALDTLIVHPEMEAILNEVSRQTAAKFRTAARYGRDDSDIKQTLVVKLYGSIHTVENAAGREWGDCLKSWLYSIATHLSLNDDRHVKVVKRHIDARLSEEDARGKLKSTEGGSHALKSADMPGQEQELLDSEQRALVRDAFQLIPERDREIMELSLDGLSLKDIAARINVSVSTVSRVEKKVLRALVREVQNGLGEERDAD